LADQPHKTASRDDYRPAAAWWTVTVLMIFQIVSMIDRQIISVLIPELRAAIFCAVSMAEQPEHHKRAILRRPFPSAPLPNKRAA
jgi:hypothetical protein